MYLVSYVPNCESPSFLNVNSITYLYFLPSEWTVPFTKAKSDQFYKIEARQEAATKNNEDWPRLTKEDLTISPEVMKIVEDIDPLTEDFDEKKARLEYLTKKYGLWKEYL